MAGRRLELIATDRRLLDEKIRAAVADAIQTTTILRPGPLAETLAQAHPDTGWPAELIAIEIERAATRAGVAVELSTPSRSR